MCGRKRRVEVHPHGRRGPQAPPTVADIMRVTNPAAGSGRAGGWSVNQAISWGGILVVAAVVALLVQGFRMAPASGMGLVLRAALGLVIALVLAVVCWNTIAGFTRPK